jgi:hypothetical protein
VNTLLQRALRSDIARRAAKTAGQTFFSVVTIDMLTGGDIDSLKKAAIIAAAAGFSVLWNAAKAWVDSIKA